MNEEELIQETRKLIGRWDNIRIVGQGWAGDTRRGFQFNPIRTVSGGVIPVTPSGACCPPSGDCFISTQAVCEGGGGTYQGNGTPCVPDPCTPGAGACCVGADCSIESESDCNGMGGIFQGVDTTCSPNPCPQPTGACCVGTDCTIETEDDCTGMGGTYQGDDTVCDPNPCTLPPCDCAFKAYDGSGRCFNNKSRITVWSLTSEGCTPELSAFVQTASGEVDLEWASCSFMSTEHVNDCINCVGDDCSSTPIGYQCFPDGWIVDSATERHQTCTMTFTAGAFTQTVVISSEIETLSEECFGTC